MRCISFVIFLTFSSCFLALPALENVTQADEIELLERKLEYLRAKKELDLELQIVKAKLQKLNQDYSDVVDTKAAVSASSTSEAPETSEPTEPAKVEEAPAKVAQGADREWVAESAWCGANPQVYTEIKIDEDGTFSMVQTAQKHPWSASIKGNLKQNKAKARTSDSQVMFRGLKAEQDGEAWNITLTYRYPGGGCDVKTVIKPK